MNAREKRELLREARNLGFTDLYQGRGEPRQLECIRGVRFLTIQIWNDGLHRVTHGTITKIEGQPLFGRHETALPTGFDSLATMYRAIAFEWARVP